MFHLPFENINNNSFTQSSTNQSVLFFLFCIDKILSTAGFFNLILLLMPKIFFLWIISWLTQSTPSNIEITSIFSEIMDIEIYYDDEFFQTLKLLLECSVSQQDIRQYLFKL
ncbi:unnamed protein product [Paramecium octaurelia]|uniref:Transmembrane protein n=1 Tax=Paramecium octaurelia TaxID=43137 RepID=A0A8S1W6N8_PAROT|nr:unnamed protein product [Paramecium octaurelia]